MVRGEGGCVLGIDHIDGLVQLSDSNIRQGNPDLLENGDVPTPRITMEPNTLTLDSSDLY